ncbi:aspartate 1-decarboxylase, partial [Francisella tularensis subsp. holarctica]|nr:aspartate 1-decarboxylase [Francisella tularensis subsp. holarctica]
CEIGDQLFIISYSQVDPNRENIKPKLVDLKTGD